MDRSRSVSRSASRPRQSSNTRSPSPMYTYTSARSRSPSRGRPRSLHPRSSTDSRSRSRSRSSSRSPTSRTHHHHHKHQHEHSTNHPHGLIKNTAGLLAGIGLATIIAHKAWPRGVLHGDAAEWEPRPKPSRRASESHHHHSSPHHHSHSHHRRPSDVAERTVERAKNLRGRGDLVYYEEIVPVRKGEPRRRDLEKRGFERERGSVKGSARGSAKGPAKGPPRLPYPEHAFPDERFYEPGVSRTRVAEKVYL